MGRLDQVTIVLKARHMKATHSVSQGWFVRLGNTNQLRLLLRKVPQHPQVIHPHRTRTHHRDFYWHRASTSRIMVVRSSSLKAGCTGSDNTWRAAFSASGRRGAALSAGRVAVSVPAPLPLLLFSGLVGVFTMVAICSSSR